MLLAATTVAALLIANPSLSNADRIAANGGFLLGNADRCGVAADRIVKAGQLVRGLIAAATADGGGQARATKRFTVFFLASALADPTKGPVASCKIVASELARLEQHPMKAAGAGG